MCRKDHRAGPVLLRHFYGGIHVVGVSHHYLDLLCHLLRVFSRLPGTGLEVDYDLFHHLRRVGDTDQAVAIVTRKERAVRDER
jgi:hypothetical protein